MRRGSDSIEERLAAAANDATPPSFTAGDLIARVKRRRRLTAWISASATVVVVLSVVAAVHVVHGPLGQDSERDGAPGPATPSGEPPGPTALPEGLVAPYICGEPFRPGNALPTRNGLSLSISSMRKVSDRTGPDIEVALSSDRPLQLLSTPPNRIEVLYLKDGVIVGGGPVLNMPGDHTPWAIDLIRYEVEVGPGGASVQKLGSRDRLCPALRWSDVWTLPGEYEVVVLLPQPVEPTSGRPLSGRELLMARAVLRG